MVARSVGSEIKDRLSFLYLAARRGAPSLWWALGIVALVAGGSVVAYLALAISRPALAAIALVILIALVIGDGAFRLQRESSQSQARLEDQLASIHSDVPHLSFGVPEIPKASTVFSLPLGNGDSFQEVGRVIRVPIINAQGAAEARQVHARIKYLPDEQQSPFAPNESIRGEWDGPKGPAVELDLPGNGMPCYLDVIFIRDRPYPHGFVWTKQSRQAGLRGHEIVTDGIPIEIEVAASGPTKPRLKDILTVTCHPGSRITATWGRERDMGVTQGWSGSNM
jgi:hypothetical protein